jgi:polyferredoxin
MNCAACITAVSGKSKDTRIPPSAIVLTCATAASTSIGVPRRPFFAVIVLSA